MNSIFNEKKVNTLEIVLKESQLRPLVDSEVQRLLKEKEELGTMWNMERLCFEWSRSDDWVKEHHLYNMVDKGIALKDGRLWIFKAKEAKEYILNWFESKVS